MKYIGMIWSGILYYKYMAAIWHWLKIQQVIMILIVDQYGGHIDATLQWTAANVASWYIYRN